MNVDVIGQHIKRDALYNVSESWKINKMEKKTVIPS